jgi:hypothetical protein
MMRVSLRETRMVLERLVQVARVPEGMVSSVRDCALYSAALELGGFDRLLDNLELIKAADISRIALKNETELDAGGLHAWLVAELAVDLAVASKRAGGVGKVRISNTLRAGELGVAAGFSVLHGFAVEIDSRSGAHATVSLRAAAPTDAALLEKIRRDGLPVAADLWWRLYHGSAAALAPDTILSRRHAGPIIVAEDGRVIGRQDDDETDFSLLTSDARSRTKSGLLG